VVAGLCAASLPAGAELLRFEKPDLLADFEPGVGDEVGPRLATDGDGAWVALWSSTDPDGGRLGRDADIFVARSVDAGLTWTEPVALSPAAASDLGMDDEVALATDGRGAWIAVWSSERPLKGRIGNDRDILFSRSTDAGSSWSRPVPITRGAEDDWGEDRLPDIAADGKGGWIAVWQSTDSLGNTIGGDPDILAVFSQDGGETWSAPSAIAPDADKDSRFDAAPRVATDRDGNWMVAWASGRPGEGTIEMQAEIVVARSTSRGASWSSPVPIAKPAEVTRPDRGVVLAPGDDGTWLAVWESSDSMGGTLGLDRDLYVARSTDEGATWSPPGPIAVNAGEDAGDDAGAVLVYAGKGRWVVGWQTWDRMEYALGADADLLVVTSEDDGLHWTPPLMLNTTATSDFGEDGGLTLATDGRGAWVAAWQSNEPIGGVVRGDHDIYRARATFAADGE
jgi:hypothetical protein